MTPEALAAKVAFGYGKAATKLGQLHIIYRPVSTGPAIDPANIVRQTPFVPSATPDGAFKRPGNWTAPEQFGLVDTTEVRCGDYLVGTTGTWFVASADQFVIPVVEQCNVVVTIARGAGLQVGLNAVYGGRTDATDTALLTEWPASLLSGGHSEAGRAMLPTDPKRFGGAVCKLPAFPGVTFRSGDRVEVQNGPTYVIGGAVLQSLGWRLDLADAET